MKAFVYSKYGTPEVLQLRDVPLPQPAAGEILIKNHAVTVAAGDWRMRKADPFAARIFNGLFGPRRVTILGFELAGEVAEVGSRVSRFRVGDQVLAACGMRFGAHAQYTCLPEEGRVKRGEAIALKPGGLSYEEAAAVPIGSTTALRFLRAGGISSGKRVLIYGASGSVGTYAVQLAAYYGAQVTAVCGPAHLEMVRSLGADRVLDYTRESLTAAGSSYDLIFDAVGKLEKTETKELLAPGGTRVSAMGSVKGNPGDLNFITELIEAGRIRPVIDRVYSFEDIPKAHRYVEQGHKGGNVVIRVPQ